MSGAKYLCIASAVPCFQIGELEHDAREELNTLKESIGHAKQKLESDVLAESMKIAHLKAK